VLRNLNICPAKSLFNCFFSFRIRSFSGVCRQNSLAQSEHLFHYSTPNSVYSHSSYVSSEACVVKTVLRNQNIYSPTQHLSGFCLISHTFLQWREPLPYCCAIRTYAIGCGLLLIFHAPLGLDNIRWIYILLFWAPPPPPPRTCASLLYVWILFKACTIDR
jgi:hypothetical protein